MHYFIVDKLTNSVVRWGFESRDSACEYRFVELNGKEGLERTKICFTHMDVVWGLRTKPISQYDGDRDGMMFFETWDEAAEYAAEHKDLVHEDFNTDSDIFNIDLRY